MLYQQLFEKAIANPASAVKLRQDFLDNLRKSERIKRMQQMFDEVMQPKFIASAVALTGGNADKAEETVEILRNALGYILLGEIITQTANAAPSGNSQETEEIVLDLLNTLQQHEACIPGLISHYDALGCRNTHDHVLLSALKLAYLQVS